MDGWTSMPIGRAKNNEIIQRNVLLNLEDQFIPENVNKDLNY